GYAFEVVPADVDEAALVADDPWRTAEATALAKARAVRALHHGATVIGGDTVVAIETGEGWTLLGKPTDDADAVRMLSLLSGREHVVVTGVAVISREGERIASETSTVRIAMTDAEIAEYVATGEPQGKAGAYAIQGGHPGIALVSGPWDNVVGLPTQLLATLLHTSKNDVR
ncbi:Maf-like protein, partial [bacterium]